MNCFQRFIVKRFVARMSVALAAVYTRPWTVELILNLAGCKSDSGLVNERLSSSAPLAMALFSYPLWSD